MSSGESRRSGYVRRCENARSPSEGNAFCEADFEELIIRGYMSYHKSIVKYT